MSTGPLRNPLAHLDWVSGRDGPIRFLLPRGVVGVVRAADRVVPALGEVVGGGHGPARPRPSREVHEDRGPWHPETAYAIMRQAWRRPGGG